jgi:uncharacterized membrane protein YqiK
VPYFKLRLARDECAVVVRRGREPELIHGPGSVRTLQRWKRVLVVSLAPFSLEVVESNVVAKDGVPLTVRGRMVAQVVDPIPAATRVVDYVDATRKMLQTAIRAAVRERPSPELSRDTTALGTDVRQRLTDALGKWGLVVSSASVDLGATGRSE